MEKLAELYHDLYDGGVLLYSGCYGLDGNCDAVIVSDGKEHYGLFLDVGKIHTFLQEKMAISHEWGHWVTGATYSLDADEITIRKQEARADRAQIRRLIPRSELQAAIDDHRDFYELVELFGVTEAFMRKALECYFPS